MPCNFGAEVNDNGACGYLVRLKACLPEKETFFILDVQLLEVQYMYSYSFSICLGGMAVV